MKLRNLIRTPWRLAALGAALACLSLASARADVVSFHSGNGVRGGTDSQIHTLTGPNASPFPTAFTAADFTAAATGALANINTPNPAWIPTLPADASAQWVSSTPPQGGVAWSTLYAINFTLTSVPLTGELVLYYAADNVLGGRGGPNAGLFINGVALPGSDGTGNQYTSQHTYTNSDLASILHVGVNTLYLNVTNDGVSSGVIFSGTITTTSAIPEPSIPALAGLFGGIALTGRTLVRRFRFRRA